MSTSTTHVCARHGVETRLRCAACGDPICLRCQVRTEAGLKCPSCAAPAPARPGQRRKPSQRSVAGVTALVAGLVLVSGVLLTVRSRAPGPPAGGAVSPAIGMWTALPDPASLRGSTTAVLLPDGRALAVGGGVGSIPLAASELYDAGARRWRRTGDLLDARRGNATTLLPGGRVLTAGGIAGRRVLASVERWDPSTGAWTPTGPLHEARFNLTLTTLVDGHVLAAGGIGATGDAALASAELFDPATGTWAALTPGMLTPRADHAAVLLHDGRVLLAGGTEGAGPGGKPLSSAELFDPAAGVFTRAAGMSTPRSDPTGSILGDGRVLLAAGGAGETTLQSAELFDPVRGTWAATGALAQGRRLAAASVLNDGSVLVTGGESVAGGTRTSLPGAEIYEPASGRWLAAAAMTCPRSAQAQVTLKDGSVLVVAGDAAFPGSPPRAQSCSELFIRS